MTHTHTFIIIILHFFLYSALQSLCCMHLTHFSYTQTLFCCCLWRKDNRHVRDNGRVCKGFEPAYCTTVVQQSGALSITPFRLQYASIHERIQAVISQAFYQSLIYDLSCSTSPIHHLIHHVNSTQIDGPQMGVESILLMPANGVLPL